MKKPDHHTPRCCKPFAAHIGNIRCATSFPCVLLLLLWCGMAKGQYSDVIRTGRPGKAIGAFTAGSGVLQFQQGLEFNSQSSNNQPTDVFLTNNVVRLGITELLEVSMLVDYQMQSMGSEMGDLRGLNNLHFGFRVHINDQNGWLPTTGFQLRLKIPNTSDDFPSENLAPVMVAVVNWSLRKKMTLATNWVLDYNGNDPIPTVRYVVNFGFPLYNKWRGFMESYGSVREGDFQNKVDGGFSYLVNNNVQLDISGGYGNNFGVLETFVNTGVSWRLVGSKRGSE